MRNKSINQSKLRVLCSFCTVTILIIGLLSCNVLATEETLQNPHVEDSARFSKDNPANMRTLFNETLYNDKKYVCGSSEELISLEFESHLGGELTTAAVFEEYAYIGEGRDLIVFDISNPANPSEIKRITTQAIINDIEVSGNYAYAISFDGLLTIDLNDPASPSIVNIHTTYETWLDKIAISGDYAYCVGEGFSITDISNPVSPNLVFTYEPPDMYDDLYAENVAVSGNYAYLASEDGLMIMDVSNPASPALVETFEQVDEYGYSLWIEDVAISGNYAYLACWNKVVIVDISNPSSPSSISTFDSWDLESIEVAGNYAYCGGYDNFIILDISDPTAPTQIGVTYDIEVETITLSGDYAYCSTYEDLFILDVSNPALPQNVGEYNTFYAESLEVSGSYAYCAAEDDGLLIIDISNPSSPTLEYEYNSIDAEDVVISGDYAYCAADDDGLVILDISNPSYPEFIENYEEDIHEAEYVEVKDNYAYVLDEDSVFSIIDVSDPLLPILTGSYDFSDIYEWIWWIDIEVSGNYAFLVCDYEDNSRESGSILLILDISNPASPALIGTYEPGNSYDYNIYSNDVAISGNYAYLATEEGFQILDISDPTNPGLVNTWGDYGHTISISGNYAFINEGFLSVLDISNPRSLVLVTSTYDCYPEDIVVSGEYIYALGWWNGFVILHQGIGPVENLAPTAEIVSVSPEIVNTGEQVTFTGTGTDTDGTVTAYNWRSSIDGPLSIAASFTTSSLSPGTHTIYFKVRDNDGAWSEEVSTTLTVNEIPNEAPTAKIISITPNPANEGEIVSFKGNGSDSDGSITSCSWRSDLDGDLGSDFNITTSDLSLGTHTIYFRVRDNRGSWAPEVSVILKIIDTQKPAVFLDACPEEHVSVNNPTSIKLNSSDTHPSNTELIIKNSEGNVILNETVTEQVVEGADYTFIWNASNASGKPVPSGDYFLIVNSTDASGNLGSETIVVSVDNDKPVIGIDSITGTTSAGLKVYTNSLLVTNATVLDAQSNITEVKFRLASRFTNFHMDINGVLASGKWAGSFDLFSVPDDGAYNVSCIATDEAGNTNSTVSSTTVILDREPPSLSSKVSRINSTHVRVNISSREPLAERPEVEINGNKLELTNEDLSGIFNLNGEVCRVNIGGMDLAGNRGNSSSTVIIKKLATTNKSGVLTSSETGTSIIFNTTEDTEDTVTFTESREPLENLTDGLLGIRFINVELGGNLTSKLSNATIKIPINDSTIPAGFNRNDVTIRFYNTTTELWEELETRVQTVGDTDYWVAQVEHFSTYAAVVTDNIPPKLDSVTPVSGQIFGQDVSCVKIRFNYSDEQTGINTSSVVFNFAGMDVTNSDQTLITGDYSSYNATGLAAGSYTASVTVFDTAGKSATFETKFTINSGSSSNNNNNNNHGGSSGGSGGSGGGGGGGSPEPQSNVEIKELAQKSVTNGNRARFEFLQGVTCVDYVEFDAKRTFGRITTVVEMLKSRSKLVTELPEGEVYRNLNIWVGNGEVATPENIASPAVGFKVEKAWLEENGIVEASVKLWRYNNDAWNQLVTKKTDEDNKYVYFEAETPGFSPFSITGLTQKEIEMQKSISEEADVKAPSSNVEKEKMSSEESEEKETPGIGTFSVFNLFMCAYLARRRV